MTGFARPGLPGDARRHRPMQPTVVLLDTDGPGASRCCSRRATAWPRWATRNPGASDGRAVGSVWARRHALHLGHDRIAQGRAGHLTTPCCAPRYASALTRAYEDGRRILFSLPCYHMFGYVEGLLSAMFVGGAVIPQTTFSAEGYFAGIQRHRADRHPVRARRWPCAMIEHPSRPRLRPDLAHRRSCAVRAGADLAVGADRRPTSASARSSPATG